SVAAVQPGAAVPDPDAVGPLGDAARTAVDPEPAFRCCGVVGLRLVFAAGLAPVFRYCGADLRPGAAVGPAPADRPPVDRHSGAVPRPAVFAVVPARCSAADAEPDPGCRAFAAVRGSASAVDPG